MNVHRVTITLSDGRVRHGLIVSHDSVSLGEQLATLVPQHARIKSLESQLLRQAAAFVLRDDADA